MSFCTPEELSNHIKTNDIIVFIYSVSSANSVTPIKSVLQQLNQCSFPKNHILILANQLDLPDADVKTQEVEPLAKSNQLAFLGSSAKDPDRVKNVFATLTLNCLKGKPLKKFTSQAALSPAPTVQKTIPQTNAPDIPNQPLSKAPRRGCLIF